MAGNLWDRKTEAGKTPYPWELVTRALFGLKAVSKCMHTWHGMGLGSSMQRSSAVISSF